MVNPHLLGLFVVAALALVLVPGPNSVYITARSLAEGRRSGVASALGVETGTLVHVAVAAAGLSYVIASSATAFAVVRYGGAAYLVYLGIRTLRGRGDGTKGAETEKTVAEVLAANAVRRAFVEGVLVNVLNPKVILFFVAFLPQFVDPNAGPVPVQIVILGLTLLSFGVTVDLIYAFGAGALGDWMRRRPKARQAVRYGSGMIYLGLGIAAIVAGPRPRV